jgi:hypothetical protein
VAICDHSLGGRITLQYSYELSTTGGGRILRPPKQTWILDSVPGRVHSSVHNVIKAISSIPLPVESKNDLAATLMKQHNFDKGTAAWMASNLRPVQGGRGSFEWIFDLSSAKLRPT